MLIYTYKCVFSIASLTDLYIQLPSEHFRECLKLCCKFKVCKYEISPFQPIQESAFPTLLSRL